MAETTQATEQASGAAQTTEAGTQATTTQQTPAEATTAQAAGASTQAEDPEVARLNRELQKTRQEAAANRVKLKEFEDAQKTEAQKQAERLQELEAETARLKAETRSASVSAAITEAAAKLGVKPELARRLVGENDVEIDEATGRVKGADAALTALVKDNPGLISGGANVGANVGNPGRQSAAEDKAEREEVMDQLTGRKGYSPFGNPEKQKAKGGGVRIPPGFDTTW